MIHRVNGDLLSSFFEKENVLSFTPKTIAESMKSDKFQEGFLITHSLSINSSDHLMASLYARMHIVFTDLQHCLLGQHNCHTLADCIQLVNGYTCKCKAGLAGDGRKECFKNRKCVTPTLHIFVSTNVVSEHIAYVIFKPSLLELCY